MMITGFFLQVRVKLHSDQKSVDISLELCGLQSVRIIFDQYVYGTPIPKHTHKYTKVKVLGTQDKHTQLSSFA